MAASPSQTAIRRRAKRALCWVAAIVSYALGCLLLAAGALLGGFR